MADFFLLQVKNVHILVKKITKNTGEKREKRFLKETLRGNIPDYLRNLKGKASRIKERN